MDQNMTVTSNPYSWNNYANVMYVDQPVGTGFSYADHYSDYVTDETGVAEDMYQVRLLTLYDLLVTDGLLQFLVLAKVLRAIPSVQQVAFLHHRRVLRRTLRPCHCKSSDCLVVLDTYL